MNAPFQGIFLFSIVSKHYRGERSNECKLSGIFQISFVACHYRGKLESYKKSRVESPTDVSAAAKACTRQQIKSALKEREGL